MIASNRIILLTGARLTILALVFGAMGGDVSIVRAQAPEDRFEIAPALFYGDATSVGAQWDISRAYGGRFRGDVLPRRIQADVAARGAAALNHEANPEMLSARVAAGLFVAIFRPPTDPDPMDPDAAPEGGFDFGSVDISAAAALESDQQLREANGVFGGRLGYVVSRQDFPWPLVPALELRLAGIVPLATDTQERDGHARMDLAVFWHIPLFATPLTLHAQLHTWSAFGLDAALRSVRPPDGLFGSLALGYGLDLPLGDLRLHEIFVRRSTGETPVRAEDRRAWLVGIVVGR